MLEAEVGNLTDGIVESYALAYLRREGSPWYMYAVSQLHIRSAASSDSMAALLLGPHAIETEWLR